jgi:low temperature requirement protein LtrA
VIAAAIDYAGPAWLTRERLAGLHAVAVAHFAERYGLFIIICLGEPIVAIGVGAAGHELDFQIASRPRRRRGFAATATRCSPLGAGARLCMCGGVAVYLVGHALFRLRMTASLELAKVVAAVAALLVLLFTADADTWVTALLVTAVLSALTFHETREVASLA